MRKISVDKLIDMVDSRYSLVTIISKRARQIIDGSDILLKTTTIKPVGVAIEEFYDKKYEAIYDYEQYKIDAEKSASETQKNSEATNSNDGLKELEGQTKE